MLPPRFTCPSCREHLTPSSSSSNEGICVKCDFIVSWKTRQYLEVSNHFIDDVEDINFSFEQDNATTQSSERITKFSKLGKKNFHLKNFTEKSVDKYEHSLFDPNKSDLLSTNEKNIIKPEYPEIGITEEELYGSNKKSKIPLLLVITIPLLLSLITFFIYRDHISDGDQRLTNSKTSQKIAKKIDHKKGLECLNDYFSATSAEEALQFILPGPKVKNSFKQYWKPQSVTNILHLKSSYLKDQTTKSHFFGVATSHEEQLFFTVIEHPEMGVRVDWRNSTEIDELSISDFINTPSRKATLIRGNLKATSNYTDKYSKELFLNYSLTNKNEHSINVFIKKSDLLVPTLNQMFVDKLQTDIVSIPVILSLKKDPDDSSIAEVKKIISLSPQEDYFFHVSLPYFIEHDND